MVWLKRIGAVILGVFVSWLFAFIALRILTSLLFPGITGQFELAGSRPDRVVLGLVGLTVWVTASWLSVRFLLRRARR